MKRKLIYILVLSVLFVSACSDSNEGTSIAGNSTSPLPTITIGKLTDGKATITMPLAVFGDSEDDLDDARIAIYRNGTTLTSSLNPVPYYVESIEAVQFVLSGLVSGDVLMFVITVSSDETTYEGTVSGDANTTASNELFSSLTETTPNITFINRDDGSNEVAIAASAFGGEGEVAGATVGLTFTYGDGSVVEKTLSAEDYYNSLSQAVIFSPSELWEIDFLSRAGRSTTGTSAPYEYGTCSHVDSLCDMTIELTLENGEQRLHVVDGTSLGDIEEPATEVSFVGFTGTGTSIFSGSYYGMQTISLNETSDPDCAAMFDGSETGTAQEFPIMEEETLTMTVEQGVVGFELSRYEIIYGTVDSNGEFLIYEGQTRGELDVAMELRGTISRTAIHLEGTIGFSAVCFFSISMNGVSE